MWLQWQSNSCSLQNLPALTVCDGAHTPDKVAGCKDATGWYAEAKCPVA